MAEAIAAFVEQGLVYRSKKPVYWSIPFETALAEAEAEKVARIGIAQALRRQPSRNANCARHNPAPRCRPR